MFTLRQLRYFEALAETNHFGRAARRVNVSQPALSAQIAQMEASLGVALFERRVGGASLTVEGTAVRERVERILLEVRELESFARIGSDGAMTGRLRIGLIASAAPYLLPLFLPLVTQRHPDLMIGVRESLTGTLVDELVRGEIDCAVLALPVAAPGLSMIELADDPFFLAVPEGEVSRIVAPVSTAALRNERLILLEEGHCLRDQALAVCDIAEASDLTSLGATSLATLLRMVAGGLGVTLAPAIAIEAERRAGIAFLPFRNPPPSRRLALVHRSSTGRKGDFATLGELLRDVIALVKDPT